MRAAHHGTGERRAGQRPSKRESLSSHPTHASAAGPRRAGRISTPRNSPLTLMTVKSFETSKTPVAGIEKAPLGGVGDDAIYITTGGFGTALNVKKGNSAFQVRVGGFKPEQEKEIEKSLALEILKKL